MYASRILRPLASLVAMCSITLATTQLMTATADAQATAPLAWGKGKKVLILGGGSSHEFDKFFGAMDTETLKGAKGKYSINYTEKVDVALAELPKVDVFITSTNQEDFPAQPMRTALFDYINSGKSAIFIHPATWYNYGDWPQYNKELIGGGSQGHTGLGDFEVKVDEPSHPIMKGVPSTFKITDELYWVKVDSSGTPIEVLATATVPDSTAQTYPSVWVVKHPKARIVCIALGHDGQAHGNPAYQTILKNALAWVVKR